MIRDAGYGPKLVREYNELNILRFIKNEGPISRAELAKRYKISKAAVSEITAHLLEQNYIHEIGMGDSTSVGGRKPILLEFNPEAGYAIGVEIKRNHAVIAISNLNARIHKKETIQFPKGRQLNRVLPEIFRIIESFQKKGWAKTSRPIGIGVAIPGLINYNTGSIQETDSLTGWKGFPLRREFENRFGIETIIENDVKTMSLGECRFGNGKNADNIIYLWIGDGLSAGIIINGELYRGVSASSGEIGYYELGYFITNTDSFKYLFNGQKNFSEILSFDSLLQAGKKYLNNACPRINGDVGTIIRCAEEGNNVAREILKEYADLVGIICINLINTINPELILISGHERIMPNKLLLGFIKEKIKADVLRTPTKAVKVKSAVLGENAGVMGAVGLVLEDLFYKERLNIHKYRNIFRKK